MIKIAISIPAYGDIFYTPCVTSLVRLVRMLERRQWSSTFATISYAEIAESRNVLLTRWFDKSDASHLLFLDADMGFEPQLVLDMVLFDKPLVGVVYPKREINLERLHKLAASGEAAPSALARAHNYILRRNARSGMPDRNGFIEVDACGAGILLIKRTCIEEMLRKLPDLSDPDVKASPLAKGLDRLIRAFDPMKVDGARLSEDFAFCQRWRHCGGEVWANISHEITHVGLHRFKARYQDAGGGPRVTVRVGGGPKVVTGRVDGGGAKRSNPPAIARPETRVIRQKVRARQIKE